MSVDLEKFSEDCASIGKMIEQLSTSNQTLRAENEKLKKERDKLLEGIGMLGVSSKKNMELESRLAEAEWLIENMSLPIAHQGTWLNRRDAFLASIKKGDKA